MDELYALMDRLEISRREGAVLQADYKRAVVRLVATHEAVRAARREWHEYLEVIRQRQADAAASHNDPSA